MEEKRKSKDLLLASLTSLSGRFPENDDGELTRIIGRWRLEIIKICCRWRWGEQQVFCYRTGVETGGLDFEERRKM